MNVVIDMMTNLNIEGVARRLIALGNSMRDGVNVQISYDRTLAELIAICAEESYIVKGGARVD